LDSSEHESAINTEDPNTCQGNKLSKTIGFTRALRNLLSNYRPGDREQGLRIMEDVKTREM